MIQARLGLLARNCASALNPIRQFSAAPARRQSIPIQIQGRGSNTVQKISVQDKTYKITADTYTPLGGTDSAPSPVAYALASLSSCNQVTGFVVARDHGIRLGEWHVEVKGILPTDVLVGGEQGNPNWTSVVLKARVQTDIEGGQEDPRFQHFVAEVERRCPITALFKLSGVKFSSEWANERM